VHVRHLLRQAGQLLAAALHTLLQSQEMLQDQASVCGGGLIRRFSNSNEQGSWQMHKGQ